MHKIITLFQRNYDTDRLVRDEITPGAEWVLYGEGVPTRKYDGVCVAIIGGQLWKRYELKPGNTPPLNWVQADAVDAVTGKQMGWIPVGSGHEDRYMREALANSPGLPHGTYEFLGPKSQGNVEDFPHHILLPHGSVVLEDAPPPLFDCIREYLRPGRIEGIVWHHRRYGLMVKIKAKDFGFKRAVTLKPGTNMLWDGAREGPPKLMRGRKVTVVKDLGSVVLVDWDGHECEALREELRSA